MARNKSRHRIRNPMTYLGLGSGASLDSFFFSFFGFSVFFSTFFSVFSVPVAFFSTFSLVFFTGSSCVMVGMASSSTIGGWGLGLKVFSFLLFSAMVVVVFNGMAKLQKITESLVVCCPTFLAGYYILKTTTILLKFILIQAVVHRAGNKTIGFVRTISYICANIKTLCV